MPEQIITFFAHSGSPTTAIKLGIYLFARGEERKASILVMRAAPASGNAGRCVRDGTSARPAAGVIVLFAAMPTGANA